MVQIKEVVGVFYIENKLGTKNMATAMIDSFIYLSRK